MSLLSRFDVFKRAAAGGGGGGETRQGMERRLVLRLLGYWRDLCGDRPLPSFADFNSADIPDMWPHCFLIQGVSSTAEAVFRDIGNDLAAHSPIPLIGKPIGDAPPDCLVAHAVAYVEEVVKTGIPMSRGGSFTNAAGSSVLYRSIVLPMSDDGTTMTGLLGAANCREVAAG